jgi:hypothetical protein
MLRRFSLPLYQNLDHHQTLLLDTDIRGKIIVALPLILKLIMTTLNR